MVIDLENKGSRDWEWNTRKGRQEKRKKYCHIHTVTHTHRLGTRMKQKERMGEVRTVEAHDKTQLVIITAPFSFLFNPSSTTFSHTKIWARDFLLELQHARFTQQFVTIVSATSSLQAFTSLVCLWYSLRRLYKCCKRHNWKPLANFFKLVVFQICKL